MSRPTFLEPLIGKSAGQVELLHAESGRVLASYVEPAFDSATRKQGLLGLDSVPEDYALILAPCSAVHTFSVRFPIDVVFVSRNGTITKTQRSVKPWRIAGKFGAHAVIEAAPGFIDRHEIVPGEILEVREIPAPRRSAEALPLIVAASARGRRAARARHIASEHRPTLADVVAEKMPLTWFESVAIVQELCEALLADGPASDPKVPELKHIALTAEGRVRLLADGPAGHSSVNRTGLVLLALTPEVQLPMQLRLLVLEEVSPRPRLNLLPDLHRELEFFERPDRPDIVRGVYERFHNESEARHAAASVSLPMLEPPAPKQHHHWWRQRRVWVGTAIVLLTLAAASVIWAWQRPESRWMRDGLKHVSITASRTSNVVIERVRIELQSARWRLGFRPRVATPAVPVLAVAPDRTAPPAPEIAQRGGAAAPQLLPGDFGVLPQGSIPAAAASSAPTFQGTPPSAGSAGGARAAAAYSASDSPPVIPPTPVSPRTRETATVNRAGQPVPEVELLVSVTGEVESVRLVSGRTSALSGMQISAIKAWRFQPATRDGVPVRYRLRVPLPAQ